MKSTNLTVGGFTQPGVARSLIEVPTNSEKGLSHRFLWLFNPLYQKFDSLGEVDNEFIHKISKLVEYIDYKVLIITSLSKAKLFIDN